MALETSFSAFPDQMSRFASFFHSHSVFYLQHFLVGHKRLEEVANFGRESQNAFFIFGLKVKNLCFLKSHFLALYHV